MNHDYQKVVETMQEIGIDESYIGKTLRLYGLEEFPKSGLDDTGLSKLVKTATEIFHSEASLTTRKPKKGYLSAPKIKKESRLEDSVNFTTKEDLKKIGGIIKGVAHVIRTPFLIPTTIRKLGNNDYYNWGAWDSLFPGLGMVEGLALSLSCAYIIGGTGCNNPKVGIGIFAGTIATNLASGIYEYVKHVKKKTEEIEEQKVKIIFPKTDEEFNKWIKSKKDEVSTLDIDNNKKRELYSQINLTRIRHNSLKKIKRSINNITATIEMTWCGANLENCKNCDRAKEEDCPRR